MRHALLVHRSNILKILELCYDENGRRQWHIMKRWHIKIILNFIHHAAASFRKEARVHPPWGHRQKQWAILSHCNFVCYQHVTLGTFRIALPQQQDSSRDDEFMELSHASIEPGDG